MTLHAVCATASAGQRSASTRIGGNLQTQDAPLLWGRFPEGRRSTPAALVSKLRSWHNQLGVPTLKVVERLDEDGKGASKFDLFVPPTSPHVVELGDGVRDAYYGYHDALQHLAHEMPNDDLSGNYLRFSEKALRIAILLGSLENHNRIEM